MHSASPLSLFSMHTLCEHLRLLLRSGFHNGDQLEEVCPPVCCEQHNMRSLLSKSTGFQWHCSFGPPIHCFVCVLYAARVSVCLLVLLRFVSGKINHMLIFVTQIVMSGRQYFCSRPELINSLKAYPLLCYEISLYYTESFFFFFFFCHSSRVLRYIHQNSLSVLRQS